MKKQTALFVTERPKKLPPLVFQREVSIHDVPIMKEVKERLAEKFTYFFPNQVEFVGSFFSIPLDPESVHSPVDFEWKGDKIVLEKSDNYLITTETSSGKTIIAILYMAKFIENSRKNVIVYSVPMKSLGSEKYEEFSKIFGGICNVHLIMGNEERLSSKRNEKTIIVTTNEKFDQLLRKKGFIDDIACVVFDELHLLNTDRGVTIEFCVSKIKSKNIPRMGLSATIENGGEISEWLDAVLISSKFRPVPIKYGFIGNEVYFVDQYGDVTERMGIKESIGKSAVDNFILERVLEKDSVLYFRHSRSGVVASAKRIADLVKRRRGRISVLELPEIHGGADGLDAKLNECIKYGVAFHHAGLSPKNRAFIEHQFKNRKIYAVIATPTLAIGVNVPARWVIVEYKAYRKGGYGDIPVSEVKQMIGRAARPEYDREGYALLYLGNENPNAMRWLSEKYFFGKSEPIVSQFKGFDDFLMSTLGFIASDSANSVASLVSMYKKTLMYKQMDSAQKREIKKDVSDAVSYLASVSPSMITINGNKLAVTAFGKIVASLYIPPRVAINMVEFIRGDFTRSDFAIAYFLFAECGVRPIRSKNSDADLLGDVIDKIEKLGITLFGDGIYDNDALKSALMFIGDGLTEFPVWADSRSSEERFFNTYGLSAGDIYNTIGAGSNFQWIVYSFRRIAKYCKDEDMEKRLSKFEIRMNYGVSEDLVELCRIKGVGKSYAVALKAAGFTSPSDIAEADPDELAKIIASGRRLGKERGEKIIKDAKRLCRIE